MARQFGAPLNRGLGDAGLGRLDRVDRLPRAGIYPNKASGAGRYGSTTYPSVIEAYNRNSDYKRWKLGQEMYFGAGRNWAALQIHSLARFINRSANDDELDANGSKEIVTAFPSKTSPEGSWYCSTRTRGSLMLPVPLESAHITLDQSSEDLSQHRLIYNCSSFYTAGQFRIYASFVGDQFEDSADGPAYPANLIPRPAGSVALTLVGLDFGSQSLIFDLSRPCTRVERGPRLYWEEVRYDPDNPLVFNTSGSRYLCSSFKFFCCCPDHLGGALSNLEKLGGSGQDRFPLPNAARDVNSAWEREGVGYYRQWRTLPERRDQRRECKHIHALRWECGVPWLEPDDYPTFDDTGRLAAAVDQQGILDAQEVLEYFARRQANWDRYILTLADTVGLVLFPGGDVRDGIRPDGRPLLWNDSTPPLPEWCRLNDWWLERGSTNLQIFDLASGQFVPTVTKGGVAYPQVEILAADAPTAPVIVR